MELVDLPIEILARILPFRENFMSKPQNALIRWLKLLPQRQSFDLIAGCDFGILNDVLYGPEFWLRLPIKTQYFVIKIGEPLPSRAREVLHKLWWLFN
ncbi:hypothetical protein CANMA_002121 [Candida margitis]|uniref:uncharacterized protein n=1 Tax=Candida margitis TaxID=1775924 RepID=UPI0022263953|nr:uncharacterized protein CANMA_002121 [Candida margitis]KAI5968685.1 hypothetical protein CANMA_002121 [Candida margitis]